MRIMKRIAPAALAVTVVACGGGGGADSAPAVVPPPATTAEGVYGGALTGSSSTGFQLLVLENGDYWALYGNQTSTLFSVAGFIQGAGASNNGSFTSSNAKDFGFAPAVGGTISATYDSAAKTISGSITEGASVAKFSGGSIPGSQYTYSKAAALIDIVGTWAVTSLTGEGIAINIAQSGAFSAVSSLGCNFSGTVAPRPSGKNVFNVSLTFGAAPCALPGQSATGIALSYPLASGKTQLVVAAIDSNRTVGTAAFGIR